MSVIYLNPYQSWKGKPADRTKKIAEYDNNQLDMFPEILPKQISALQPNSDFHSGK
jgi:hypothetical protein